jgi:hypothetical protein
MRASADARDDDGVGRRPVARALPSLLVEGDGGPMPSACY